MPLLVDLIQVVLDVIWNVFTHSQHLGKARHHSEEIVEVVGDARSELPDGSEAILTVNSFLSVPFLCHVPQNHDPAFRHALAADPPRGKLEDAILRLRLNFG